MADVDPRVVQVFCEFDDGRRSTTGSGYLLDDGLVLTAAHVLGRDNPGGSRPSTDSAGAGPKVECVVEWHRYEDEEPDRARVDAALLRIVTPDWRPPENLPPLRWGRLVTGGTDIPVRLTGFPTAMDARDRQGRLVIRDSIQVSGVVNAGSSVKGKRYHVAVRHGVPSSSTAVKSRWEGASGAAVTCHGLLLGVVAESQREPNWAWMSAVPTPVLLADPEFRELVGSPLPEPAELQPVLEQATRLQVHSRVSLLRSENEVVGFDHRRDEVVEQLRTWCEVEGWFSVRLVTGPGGQGKTRLAARLIAVLHEKGWSCGFLDSRATRQDLTVVGELITPSLLVVDYAEARAGQIADLFDVLDRRSRAMDDTGRITGAPPVRVLLLTRYTGEWWENLRTVARLVRDLPPGVVLPLPDLYADADRSAALRSVVRDLGVALAAMPGLSPSFDVESLPLPDVDDPRFGRALDLHMAGLVALLQAIEPVPRDAPDEPDEAVLLRHEQRFWTQIAGSFGLDGLSLSDRRRLVAVATLCVARDADGAEHVLARLASLSGEGAVGTRRRVARWLAALYPSDRDFWGPLRPDRIGEHLVGIAVSDTPDLLDQALPTATGEELLGAFQVLARTANHSPHVAAPLTKVIVDHPAALAPAAIAAATKVEHPEPLRTALAEVVEQNNDDLPLLDRLYHEVPNHSQALATWTVGLAERVAHLVASGIEDGTAEMPDLAAALNHLAYRLTAAGHPELALPRNDVAIRLYDQLTAHTPGRYEADLAAAVENRAEQLYLVGERAEAVATVRRAVDLRRLLADTDGDRRLLADALTGYGHHLSAAGEHEVALVISREAVDVYRGLSSPVRESHDREYSTALMALAISLVVVHEIDEAVRVMREAVALLRSLARRFPDAHRPDLAAALTNYAMVLGEAGSVEPAAAHVQESLALYEVLAQGLPDAHLVNHAAALHAAADTMMGLGLWTDAEQCAAQAVELFERVAATGTGEHGLNLATALDTHAIALSECGRTEDAVRVGLRAVDVLRPLAADGDLVVRERLGGALRNLAEVLREAGRSADARPYSAEALDLYREIARRSPESIGDELGMALYAHGQALVALDSAAAVGFLREGLELAREADDQEVVAMFVVALDEVGLPSSPEAGFRE